MKRKLLNPITLVCCLFMVVAAIADLNGKWVGAIKTPDGNDLTVIYSFKVDGDRLTGTAESPAGTVSLDSGRVSGDTFKFQVTVNGNVYPHSGKIYADSCGLDIDFGGQKTHTTLKRAVEK
jgi:hypothetical protein